jgi:hypothetical protein
MINNNFYKLNVTIDNNINKILFGIIDNNKIMFYDNDNDKLLIYDYDNILKKYICKDTNTMIINYFCENDYETWIND